MQINPTADTVYNAQTAMQEGSVSIRTTVRRITQRYAYKNGQNRDTHINETVVITDDGNGNLQRQKGGPILGTVNYATGEVTFDARQEYTFKLYEQTTGLMGTYWANKTGTEFETYSYASPTATIRWAAP